MSLRFRKSVSLLMLVAWPVAMLVASVSHDHAHSHGETDCQDAAVSSTHDHGHAHHHGHSHSHSGDTHHHSHDGCHSHHDDAVTAEHSCDHPSEPLPHDHDCESCRFLGIPAISIAVTVPPQIPEILEFRPATEPAPVFPAPTAQAAVRGPPVA